MPQVATLIALLGLLGAARFDRYTLDAITGAATVTWNLGVIGVPTQAQTLANLLVGLLALTTGAVLTQVSVNAAGVPQVAVRIPAAA